MSSISNSVSSNLDFPVLFEESNTADFELEPFDALSVSWYERSWVVKTQGVALRLTFYAVVMIAIALYCVYVCTENVSLGVFVSSVSFFFESSLSFSLLKSIDDYLETFRYYRDPAERRLYREELLDNTLSVYQFINKHGWEDIFTWGFHIHPTKEPLITKNELATKFLEGLEKDFTFFVRNFEYKRLYTTKYSRDCDYKKYLYEAVKYRIFNEEQLKKVQELFDRAITNMSGLDLLNYWAYIRQAGLNTNFKHQKIYEWAEENYEKFNVIWSLYNGWSINEGDLDLVLALKQERDQHLTKSSFSGGPDCPEWLKDRIERLLTDKLFTFNEEMQTLQKQL